MPCTSDGYPEPSAQQYDRQLAAKLYVFAAPFLNASVTTAMKRRAADDMQLDDAAVQALCGLLTKHCPDNPAFAVTYSRMKHTDEVTYFELRLWWAKHKVADAARREIEAKLKTAIQLRQEALAKLSAAEREALGIKEG